MEDVLTCVVDNILHTLIIKAEDENGLSFTSQQAASMVIHYTSDWTEWQKEAFSQSTILYNVKKYYVLYGLTDEMASIYMKISPDKPLSQPKFYRMHDNGMIRACASKNWFRLYNTGLFDYYLYSDTEKPVPLHPQQASRIYTYETDVILRKENNYIHLSLRDLSSFEKENLVPCDLMKNIYTYTRWASINWMPKQDYQWVGTLSVIKENDSTFDCIFTDGTSNFTYPVTYVKKLLKYISYGKITGTFTFEAIISGSHIRYIPMPLRKQQTVMDDTTEFIID